MEAKTMGKFIAALRKANGMTQKELAEKLNVSDKSVSRWETDEGSPDLSLIPVIAEIFQVSCDELLRGERKPEAQRAESGMSSEESSAKAEKQRQRILKSGLSKYRSKTLLAVGIGILGLIAASICNTGFQRSYLGFFIGTAFYLAAVICQIVFVNSTLLGIADAEGDDGRILQYKGKILREGMWALGAIILLFAFTLPLVTLCYDSYIGLNIETWVSSGMLYAAAALVGCFTAGCLLLQYFENKGILPVVETRRKNRKLLVVVGLACAFVMVVTSAVQIHLCDPARLEKQFGTTFEDYTSFKEFVERNPWEEDGNASFEAVSPEEEIVVYDSTEEEKVLFTYVLRNPEVSSILFSYNSEDGLPITVTTTEQWNRALEKQKQISGIFMLIYLAEILTAIVIYQKKKAK